MKDGEELLNTSLMKPSDGITHSSYIMLLLNYLNARLAHIKCMFMSRRCLGVGKQYHMPVIIQVFVREMDGIKVWVNDQPVISSLLFIVAVLNIPQVDSLVL